MKKILKTNENISTLAITYLDEVDETLKEISNGGLYFATSPFEAIHKRLYVIGDMLYDSVITISAEVAQYFRDDYTVQLKLGANDFVSFEESTNTSTKTLNIVTSTFVNAMPLDVLVTSKNITEKSTKIIFTISAEKISEPT